MPRDAVDLIPIGAACIAAFLVPVEALPRLLL